MGFSRQEYWSGLPCPPPGDLPDPGVKHMGSNMSLTSPVLAGRFFTTRATWVYKLVLFPDERSAPLSFVCMCFHFHVTQPLWGPSLLISLPLGAKLEKTACWQTPLPENPLWEKSLGEIKELCRSYNVVVVFVVVVFLYGIQQAILSFAGLIFGFAWN